jgi:hypothetical protein
MCEFYCALVSVLALRAGGHADYSVCFFEELVGRCGGWRTRLPLGDCGACMFVLEELVDI